MEFKNKTCSGAGKVSNERLTVLLCSSIIGEFERPLIIGIAERLSFQKIRKLEIYSPSTGVGIKRHG